jgi:hypothetical protein
MKVYTVHEPQDVMAAADRVDRAEGFAFVADGFNWLTAAFAPFVLAAHRMWVGLAVYVAALVAVIAILWAFGASPEWIALAVAALHVIFGFEVSEMRRAQLETNGWAMLGTVTGRSRVECERRFIEDWLPGQPLISHLRSRHDAAPQGDSRPAAASERSSQPVWKRNFPWARKS